MMRGSIYIFEGQKTCFFSKPSSVIANPIRRLSSLVAVTAAAAAAEASSTLQSPCVGLLNDYCVLFIRECTGDSNKKTKKRRNGSKSKIEVTLKADGRILRRKPPLRSILFRKRSNEKRLEYYQMA